MTPCPFCHSTYVGNDFGVDVWECVTAKRNGEWLRGIRCYVLENNKLKENQMNEPKCSPMPTTPRREVTPVGQAMGELENKIAEINKLLSDLIDRISVVLKTTVERPNAKPREAVPQQTCSQFVSDLAEIDDSLASIQGCLLSILTELEL